MHAFILPISQQGARPRSFLGTISIDHRNTLLPTWVIPPGLVSPAHSGTSLWPLVLASHHSTLCGPVTLTFLVSPLDLLSHLISD